MSGTDRLLVLFDRDCGLCTTVVDRLRAWDRDARLELLPLQDAPTDARALVRALAADHPLHDELHVIDLETGAVRSGGRAVVEIAGRLPGGRLPAALAGVAPAAWALGLGYALIARNRQAIGRAMRLETACRVASH